MWLPPKMQVELLSSLADIHIDGFDVELKPLYVEEVEVERTYLSAILHERLKTTVQNCQQDRSLTRSRRQRSTTCYYNTKVTLLYEMNKV